MFCSLHHRLRSYFFRFFLCCIVLGSGISTAAWAKKLPIAVKMYQVTPAGQGRFLGSIIASDTPHGLLLVPRLHGLPPGHHAFHLHVHPSCARSAAAAGGHWDPKHIGRHRGPYRAGGHLGDLPMLFVNASGFARRAVLAPRLTVTMLQKHALVIHQKDDTYTDRPAQGGGGARIACGVVRPRS